VQNKASVVAIYCRVYPEVRGTHAFRTYLRQEPLSYFFMPVPTKKAFPNEIVFEQQLCRWALSKSRPIL